MKNVLMAAAVAASLVACAGKEEYNGLDHDEVKYDGETVAYKVYYTVKLNDPAVREVADVLVRYVDADGTVKQDTMDGATWQKPVVFTKSATMNYGLIARYFAKANPALTNDTYNFGVDLSSKMYQMSSMGDSMQIAVLRSQTGECTGILKYDGGTMDRETVLTEYGADRIDSTTVYYRLTSVKNDSAMVRSKFVWSE